ncbi:MAG TPA: helix-turn-helix transcriptional regulator [Rhizobiaceae bacterium]|nr:helix-turn-helix transcriptional regulator [Rhizobiaceae bacterium]
MTPEQFKAWRRAMGLSQGEAAGILGLSRGSIENYERGRRREDDRPVDIPASVAIGCVALLYAKADPRLEELIAAALHGGRASKKLDQWLSSA